MYFPQLKSEEEDMRYFTWTAFLALIMIFAGCGDKANDEGDTGAGNGAAKEMPVEQAPAEEPAAMDEGSDAVPAWQVLEQNVVHSE